MNTEQNHYRIVLYIFFCFAFNFCFSIQLLLAAVAVLLINQIRIEIIFRIHMPGRINQKREREKYTTITVVVEHWTTTIEMKRKKWNNRAKAQNKDRWFSYPLSGKLRIAACGFSNMHSKLSISLSLCHQCIYLTLQYFMDNLQIQLANLYFFSSFDLYRSLTSPLPAMCANGEIHNRPHFKRADINVHYSIFVFSPFFQFDQSSSFIGTGWTDELFFRLPIFISIFSSAVCACATERGKTKINVVICLKIR